MTDEIDTRPEAVEALAAECDSEASHIEEARAAGDAHHVEWCEWMRRIARTLRALSARSPAPADAAREAARGLNCRDDAQDCPACGSGARAMVGVIRPGVGRLEAVACFECDLRGPARPTMHEAVEVWNEITTLSIPRDDDDDDEAALAAPRPTEARDGE